MEKKADAYGLLIRGRELLGSGHPHQAAIILERASRMEPKKSSIREALAQALYNSGQTHRAREEFARVVELDPSNDYAYFGLGLCQARMGNRQSALGQLKIAVAMRPDSEDYRRALLRLAG
ncbi:MAG: tetratricopeptide repeat protein [Candidatus Methylomirabilales bacterium]